MAKPRSLGPTPWTRLLNDWSRSGLKVAAFCRARAFSRKTLYRWKDILSPAPPAKPPPA